MAARKKRAGSTVTLSVSVRVEDAKTFRNRAKRLHGGNVSAAIGDAAELLRLEERQAAFAAKLDAELGPIDEAVVDSLLRESLGLLPPVRKKRRRKAA